MITIYGIDCALLILLSCFLIYVLVRYKKQMRRVNGCFFPMFYLYSVILICIRIGTCVVILASPRTVNTFLHIYESQDNSLDSLAMLNTAAKIASFVFGCIIVSTLYNTILILRHVHLHQLEQT